MVNGFDSQNSPRLAEMNVMDSFVIEGHVGK